MSSAQEPVRLRTNALAIASFVVSLFLCCCGFNGVVSIILGLVALSQIKRRPEMFTGRGLAIAGVALGAVSVAGALFFQGFMISRYHEVKPVAERTTIHIQRGEFEQARANFAHSIRSDPEFDQELTRISEYLNQRGQLVELRTGYNINVNLITTAVVFNAVFESGTVRLTCTFVKEDGEWRLLGYRAL